MWIEEKEANALWEGKASNNRISYYFNKELLQLAIQNYEFTRSIYRNELAELKRWSDERGLSNMGFGREKTTYCYFAVASATSVPHDSNIRMLVAKSGIIITVADDFFDMEGSLCDLERLTDAIKMWNSRGLSSHSKVIFDALDDLVSETATRYFQQEGTDITHCLQDIWYETFLSWLVEAKWSRNGHRPSTDDYLKNGMISIAAHSMVLPSCCFLKPSLPNEKLGPAHYEPITKLLMVIARLLNDIQSYEKEKEEGKMNFFGTLTENPESNIEDSVAIAEEIIGIKKKEFLEHVLINGHSDLPKHSKHFHLSCLKVFHMFYDSSNRFDSKTELLRDINKAFYLPLRHSKPKDQFSLPSAPKKKCVTMNFNLSRPFKQVSYVTSRRYGMAPLAMAPKVVPRFI
ncbi:hypothetical protein L6164_036609 [Bauhinia variegata]|uniref:Uncharacterized protein n=1 Tax=Bauhinia variegata TaxID=167791 RepID=A0ACB9KHJ5_BAUVA|nr:hypothetical protein L6164_036609 [Bauhinia variegata]